MRSGDRKLHTLILSDRPAKYDALLGIVRRASDKVLGIPEAFGGDQNAFGIHTINNVLETFALLADQILGGNLEIVDEDFAGVVIDHGVDLADLDTPSLGFPQIDQEDRETI